MLVVGSDFTRINDCLEFLKIDRNNSDWTNIYRSNHMIRKTFIIKTYKYLS